MQGKMYKVHSWTEYVIYSSLGQSLRSIKIKELKKSALEIGFLAGPPRLEGCVFLELFVFTLSILFQLLATTFAAKKKENMYYMYIIIHLFVFLSHMKISMLYICMLYSVLL